MLTAETTIVIPARYDSTRLPGKPLLEIHGKPMVYWVARKAATSGVGNYIVATDDERILTTCRNYQIPCMLTSPNYENGTERVAEVTRKIRSDYYINIQGDEPLVSVSAIQAMHRYMLKREPIGFVQAAAALAPNKSTNESIVKMAISDDCKIVYLSRSPIKSGEDALNPVYYRCLGLYAYSGKFCQTYAGAKPARLEEVEKIEQLRSDLIEQGDSLINETIEQFPSLDRQKMRQLVRNAAKEVKAEKPGKGYKELFQYLKDAHTVTY